VPQKSAVIKTRKLPKAATPKKTISKKTANQPVPYDRKRKIPKYKSFALSKRLPHPAGPLPSVRQLIKKSRKLLFSNKKALLIVLVIYAVLYVVLVRGFTSPVDVSSIKQSLNQSLGTAANKATFTSAVFASLLGASSASNSDTASTYQGILLIGLSLAVVWIFRQYAAGNKPTAKAALYLGMYPLVPFLLVLVVMALQTIPILLALFVYGVVITGGIAATGLEQGLWYIVFGGLFVLSLYMLCSSMFALYIVTLPEMTPLKALRSARQLVFSRRLNILVKLLVLPLLILIVLAIVVIPTIYFVPIAAPWVYFAVSLFSLLFLHAYLFSMYKELL
jgi:hypothetical protein